jgi:glycosyltransferase involved in cell wall biosynthesis
MPVTEAVTPDGCRVWIVNHYADAPDQPAGTRHFDLARQLVARGRSVTIFAAGFGHGEMRAARMRPWQLFRTQQFDGVQFVWLWTFPYRGNTWRRPINMLSYVMTFLVVQTRFASPDHVIGSTVHPFAAVGAWFAARLRGARFLFEVRDLWPQTLVDLGAMRDGSPGERLLRAIEAFLVRRAAVVITLLPGMRDYLRGRGLPLDHVTYVPNGVDLAAFDAAAAAGGSETEAVRQALRAVREFQAQGRFTVCYLGAFGRVNQVGVIIRAVAIAESRAPGRVGLVLVGNGPERSTLEELAASCDAIVVCPPVPKRSVPGVLKAVDGTVVHTTDNPVYRYGISFNKLFDYMASARPILFACTSAYDPVAATGAGISVRPDDPEALADAFLELADAGPEAWARMGAAGRDYVTREHSIERLGDVLAGVVPCDPGTA